MTTRILRVVSSMDPASGGPPQGIRNLAPEMVRQGIEQEVVSLDPPGSPDQWNDAFLVHALGSRKTSWAWSARLSPWFKTNLSRFDAVMVHGLWQYPAYAARKACLAVGIPYFVMPHGMLDPWFQRDSSRRGKAFRNWIYWKLIEHKTIRDAEAVLFTCETEKLLAREPFRPYAPREEITVGYGIEEPPPETPAEKEQLVRRYPELQDTPYLLFLSRIHPKKGLDLLIEAYASHTNSIENGIIPALVIAGPGLDTPYGQECLDLCKKNKLPTTIPSLNTHRTQAAKNLPSVIFPGMVEGPLKWGALRNAEAFVLPSHQENFGIAVVESLACETPVLISNRVNIWREIEAANAGLIADDTAKGCEELLQSWQTLSESERRTIRQNTHECFEKHFRTEASARAVHRVLRSSS